MMAGYDDFIKTYGPFAEQIAQQTGQDPATVLGLLAHETSYGTHIAGNNIFGISPGGKDIVKAYPNIEAAGQAYVNLMKQPRYAGVANAKGPDAQAIALQLSGYNSKVPNYGVQVSDKIRTLQQAGYAPAPSVDDVLKMRQGIPSLQVPSTAPPAVPATPSVPAQDEAPSADDVLKMRQGIPSLNQPVPGTPPSSAAPPVVGQPAVTAPPPSVVDRTISGIPEGMKNFAIGAAQGAKSVIDPQAEWLARHLGDNPLTRALGIPSSQDVAAADAANAAAYQQKYGDSTYAGVGNLVGQGAALGLETAPISMVGGSLATALRTPQLVAGAPTVLSNAPRLLQSGAMSSALPAATGAPLMNVAYPNVARGVNLLTGVVQGGAGAALTGGNPLYGAAAGGALGVGAEGLKYLADSRVLNNVMANPAVRRTIDVASGLAGFHYTGDPYIAALTGLGVHSLKDAIPPVGNALMRTGAYLGPRIAPQAGAIAGQYDPIP